MYSREIRRAEKTRVTILVNTLPWKAVSTTQTIELIKNRTASSLIFSMVSSFVWV
jgi:hypothetical protein